MYLDDESYYHNEIFHKWKECTRKPSYKVLAAEGNFLIFWFFFYEFLKIVEKSTLEFAKKSKKLFSTKSSVLILYDSNIGQEYLIKISDAEINFLNIYYIFH